MLWHTHTHTHTHTCDFRKENGIAIVEKETNKLKYEHFSGPTYT